MNTYYALIKISVREDADNDDTVDLLNNFMDYSLTCVVDSSSVPGGSFLDGSDIICDTEIVDIYSSAYTTPICSDVEV